MLRKPWFLLSFCPGGRIAELRHCGEVPAEAAFLPRPAWQPEARPRGLPLHVLPTVCRHGAPPSLAPQQTPSTAVAAPCPRKAAAEGRLAPGPGGTTLNVNTKHTAAPAPQRDWVLLSRAAPAPAPALPSPVISAVCVLALSGKEMPAQIRPPTPAKSEALGVPLGKIGKMEAAAVFILNVLFPLPAVLKEEMGIVIPGSLRLPTSPVNFFFLVYEDSHISSEEGSEQEPGMGALNCSQSTLWGNPPPARVHHPSRDVLFLPQYIKIATLHGYLDKC